jgi:hypothetical protein
VVRAVQATPGSDAVIAQVPHLADIQFFLPLAVFTPGAKIGTAQFLDIWDCDHFDLVTDMEDNLSEGRVWFSDRGFTAWDAPETRTGRINCHFTVPVEGNYVCSVTLQSDGGPAQVECLIDSFNFGPLPFNGSITQPHPSRLSAGPHDFKIRQMFGAYSFFSLIVFQVL